MAAIPPSRRDASAAVRWPRWRDRWFRPRLRLRAAGAEDFPALAKLQESGWRPYSEVYFPWDPHTFARDFAAGQARVLECGRQLAGFYLIQSRRQEGHLLLAELHIHPDFRNHGLGELLADFALEEAKAEALPLRLWVLRNNPARHLYERLGFTVAGEGSCYHIMERHADQPPAGGRQIPAKDPVLSPTRSTLAPKRSSKETYKFVIGLPR